MRKETRYEMILNHILDVFPQDKNLVLIDVYDNETGVVYAIGRPMFRKDYMDYNIKPKTLEPFIRVSSNPILEKEYYSYFSRSEQGDIFKIFRSVDGFGRIKYGENYQQYCRKEEDLATVLDLEYSVIKKRLVSKLKKYDILRVIENSDTNESYLSINPVLMVNGSKLEKDMVIGWIDVIREHGLLKDSQIRQVVGRNFKYESKI